MFHNQNFIEECGKDKCVRLYWTHWETRSGSTCELLYRPFYTERFEFIADCQTEVEEVANAQ